MHQRFFPTPPLRINKEQSNLTGHARPSLRRLSLRGRRSKGKGKGIRARDHALPARAQIPPFPSPFNACHAGYARPDSIYSIVASAQLSSSFVFSLQLFVITKLH